MKRILNIGSLNIDHVYRVPHFVRPGQTLVSASYSRGPGGKGLNQSIAAARAGAAVAHAGCIGDDGRFLLDLLTQAGADTARVAITQTPTGHAIIQTDAHGENCIVLYPGANHEVRAEHAQAFFDQFGDGDLLLLQNEITDVGRLIELGKARGMTVLFNPAPMTQAVGAYPLDMVDIAVLNESEAAELSGVDNHPAGLESLRRRLPGAEIIVTLGARGCAYRGEQEAFDLPAVKVEPVDTTAAGDTFVGYLAAGIAAGISRREALQRATRAAALAVQRPGAANAIPHANELTR